MKGRRLMLKDRLEQSSGSESSEKQTFDMLITSGQNDSSASDSERPDSPMDEQRFVTKAELKDWVRKVFISKCHVVAGANA